MALTEIFTTTSEGTHIHLGYEEDFTASLKAAVKKNACPFCRGTGFKPEFAHIYGGICFRCDGKG